MIDVEKMQQYGEYGLDIQGIMVSNTSSELSARQLFDWLNGDNTGSEGTHYYIDHDGIVCVMPLSWKTWVTGKGNDWAFNHCISVHICSNIDDALYKKGQDKAVELIKELMFNYGLTVDDVYFQNDFNKQRYNPADILRLYRNKKNFIERELL